MPLNVRRLYTSAFLILFGTAAFAEAQTPGASPSSANLPAAPQQIIPVKSATSAEVMRDRISKAKAYIAVRNYNAAVYELENIRRETSDSSVQAVTNVLLMNSYLEQGDYKRAQEFLDEAYKEQKTKPNSLDLYNAIAGQVVKGARNKVERYRALGLMVSDRDLPLEAVNDVERMRETLEVVITQTKDIGKDKTKSNSAIALLEEATNSRGALARDDYDARRWKDEVADSREQLANSRSVITNAVDGTTIPTAAQTATVAMNNSTPPVVVPAGAAVPISTSNSVPKAQEPAPQVTLPVSNAVNKPSDTLVATNNNPVPVNNNPVVEEKKKADEPLKTQVIQNAPKQTPVQVKQDATPQTDTSAAGPMEVGSLVAYATVRSAPVYPPAAKTMRASGVVKVEVTVNESGDVADVQKMSGHSLLQTAARDAVRKWKFKPFVRDGQPVKATGFVNFNFSL